MPALTIKPAFRKILCAFDEAHGHQAVYLLGARLVVRSGEPPSLHAGRGQRPVARGAELDGEIGWAIFIAIWSIAAGLLTDNVLRPYLISRGSDLPLILILFGVVGGAVAFGVLGLFLGPTLLAVGYELIREWNAVDTADASSSTTERSAA